MDVPVLVGSGITVSNVHEYRGVDGFIIGSHFKKRGMYENIYFKAFTIDIHKKYLTETFFNMWQNELDETVILEFMNCLR